MKKFKELKLMVEEKKDKYDEGEYDQEGDMAKSDLRSIMANAKELHDMIDDADNLPEWCQNKITLAEDYISTVANYLTAEMSEGAIPAKEKTVTVKHKTSGKELVVTAQKAKELKQQDYHPVKEEVSKADVPAYLRKQKGEKPLTMSDVKAPRKDSISAKENLAKARNEEVEQIEEMDTYPHPDSKEGKALMKAFKSSAKKDPTDLNAPGKSPTVKQTTSALLPMLNKSFKKSMKKEEVEQIDEKNEPTNPELWSRAKALARSKFDVYPSAYANGWASKWYKGKGGSWKSVSEATDPPFDKPYTTIKKVVTDKSGAKHSPMSRARDIARMAMKKQMDKMKPVKESLEESRKAEIVKEIIKKKKDKSEDAFQKDPELTTTLAKGI
jgi:hypothetical protein